VAEDAKKAKNQLDRL